MVGVGGGIAVGDHEPALLVPLAPHLFVGGVPVYGVEGGSGVGVHIRRVGAELSAEIHFDQCGAGLRILGKYQLFKGYPVLRQALRQKAELGGLAGPIGALNDYQFTHFSVSFLIIRQFIIQ